MAQLVQQSGTVIGAHRLGPPRQRSQISEQRRDQFGDCRVDVRGALNHRVRGVGVHDVEQRVHDFVADGEDCRAEDFIGLGVDQDFHETLGFASFAGAAYAGHHHTSDQRLAARFPDLALGHADASQVPVDEQAVGGYATTHPAGVVVEQVGGEVFKIIVGGVGEGVASVDVASRQTPPDIS